MGETGLRSLDDFDRALAAHVRLLLFLHHPQGPAGAAALAHYRQFCAALPDVPTLLVDALEQPELARSLAARCGAPLPPPQAILLQQGRPVWRAAHGAISRELLLAAWAGACC